MWQRIQKLDLLIHLFSDSSYYPLKGPLTLIRLLWELRCAINSTDLARPIRTAAHSVGVRASPQRIDAPLRVARMGFSPAVAGERTCLYPEK